MITLGIDTSNYATSLAAYDGDAGQVIGACKRFLPVKEGQLGLRQSDAVFHHVRQLPELLDELRAQCSLSNVRAVGVSVRPRSTQGSYMPCFLVGEMAAAAFAAPKGLPVIYTSHQQGHIAAAFLGSGQTALLGKPALVFHVSGGTTDLLLVNGLGDFSLIGTSSDLYAGQAIDRLGGLLGFSFPSGEAVSSLAESCEDEKVGERCSVQGMQCSFSGLENQCAKLLAEGAKPAFVCKYCLLSIGKTILQMVRAAREKYGSLPLIAAGGVMSSRVLAPYLQQREKDIYFAPPSYSSDNGIGNAYLAFREVAYGECHHCERPQPLR